MKQCKIGHMNINSIRHKWEPVKEVLEHNIFDVMSIQETKLDDSFPKGQFSLHQYKVYRKDYKSNQGGLMLIIRHDLPQVRRYDLENVSINDINGRIEILAVETLIRKEKWILISIYKQPKVGINYINETIDKLMLMLAQNELNIVILGDFNINMLKRNVFSDCLDIHGLVNIVKDVTCFKGTPSMIDLVITNKPKRFINTISVDTGLSDFHCLLCTATKIQLSALKPTTFKYRSYRKFDNESFSNDLAMIPYHVTEIFDDVNDSYWLWHELTMEVVNDHAPLKIRKIQGHSAPYMNGELRRAINVKNMLKRKYDKVNNSYNWEKYRLQRNLVTKLRKRSINIYLSEKCNSKTNKNGYEFWNTVKPLISSKAGAKHDNIILVHDETVYTSPHHVSNLFNSYFTSIARNIGNNDYILENDNVMLCIEDYKNHESVKNIKTFMQSKDSMEPVAFSFHPVTAQDVKKCIDRLQIKKATGHDMLPSKLIKLGSEIFCSSVTTLINMSIDSCNFPDSLKYAEITPLYKKGNNLDVCNYRPVSILPSMSKIFERQMINQFIVYFDEIFSKYMSGFRSKHSCETVLMRMTENIKRHVDEGKIVCLLLMDLSRAFDCLPYKLFVSKLHAYGFSLSACQLMFNYYCFRKQRVKLGNTCGQWQNIFKGSAQGSVMGPITYNMFTNDMFLILNDDVEFYNYVDDNSLLAAGYDYTETKLKLLHNVEKIVSWFELNQMKINPDKFNYIVFGNCGDVDDINLNGNIIKVQDEVKILGLHLDKRLTFHSHISKICQKAGNQVHALCRLSNILSESNKLLVYSSFVECYFNYCCCIWHHCSKSDTYKLERLQHKALKYITGDFDSPYADILHTCHKSPLFIARIYKCMEVIFKVNNNLYPDYVCSLFTAKVSCYDLRAEHNLALPSCNTVTYGKKSIKYIGPFYWNVLPNSVKSTDCLHDFKTKLKLWIPECKCGFCVLCQILKM
jgi:hypothetical protein